MKIAGKKVFVEVTERTRILGKSNTGVQWSHFSDLEA